MSGSMNTEVINATIGNGTSLSAAVAVGAKQLCGIAMPAAWDAADLTFQASVDGGATWLEMQSVSAAIDYKAAASQYIAVDPAIWRGVTMVKVRSGTASVAVNQTADRVIGLVVKPLA